MSAALKPMIVGLVSGIEPTDDLGREHRRNALSWLGGTDDIFRREKDLCVALRRTRITRDLAQVVVVAVANGAAQGPHDLGGIVVGSLDVHRLSFETEGDIAASFPGTEMARASGEVRVRLEAELARICDRAEYH